MFKPENGILPRSAPPATASPGLPPIVWRTHLIATLCHATKLPRAQGALARMKQRNHYAPSRRNHFPAGSNFRLLKDQISTPSKVEISTLASAYPGQPPLRFTAATPRQP